MKKIKGERIILVGQGKTTDVAYSCGIGEYADMEAADGMRKDSSVFYVVCEPWTQMLLYWRNMEKYLLAGFMITLSGMQKNCIFCFY